MALVVGLNMHMVVVGGHKVVVMGLVLDIVSCWDPRYTMCSVLLAMDSPLDESK